MPTRSEDTESQEHALETVARAYAQHSGPRSDERERRTFARDLHHAALRYARAYYAEARELGLIPEYERKPAPVSPYGSATGHGRAVKSATSTCTDSDCPDH